MHTFHDPGPIDLEAWKPDAEEIEKARARIVADITEYLQSGECPEPAQEKLLSKTCSDIASESDQCTLRSLIQEYFLDEYYHPITEMGAELRLAIGGKASLPEIMGDRWPLMEKVLGLPRAVK